MASGQSQTMASIPPRPKRPASRRDFEIAIICALTLEADAVDALIDHHWNDDDGEPFDKAPGDPNAYSTGTIGRHNVVLTYMPGMGKANAAAVASNCRGSFPNIKLAIVVGVCGVAPFKPDGGEIVLGDVIVSNAVVQYDLGRKLPEGFVRKDTLLDSLGRPNAEIRTLLAKLSGLRGRKTLQAKMARYLEVLQAEQELAAHYPGASKDRLFEASYRHVADGDLCEKCGCNGPLLTRKRLEQGNVHPMVHFGHFASGDTVMKSGEERDAISRREGVLGFEMEGAGVWDNFPCLIVKGACDYADSHKMKSWQRYAASTAAACAKALLDSWVPSLSSSLDALSISSTPQLKQSWFLVPYPRNATFVGRSEDLGKLQQQPLDSDSQTRVSIFGLGGIGKTQIVLEYAYLVRETFPDVSVFWIHASNADRILQSFTRIAQECQVPGSDDPKADVMLLVKIWLERKDRGPWVTIMDNADDADVFFPSQGEVQETHLAKYIPECAHGSILVTTRDKKVGLRLAKGNPPIEIRVMDTAGSEQLLRTKIGESASDSHDLLRLSSRLEHLPLALAQAAAFMQENTMSVEDYLDLLDGGDQTLVKLLSEEFDTIGRDSSAPRAVAETWIISFEQIQRQSPQAAELLSLISFFDRQGIPEELLVTNRENINPVQERLHFQKALGVLKAFSFVTVGSDHTLNIHRLVQLVTQNWLIRKNQRSQFAERALLAAEQTFPKSNFETWSACRKYLPHVLPVLNSHEGEFEAKETAASLLYETANYLHDVDQLQQAEAYATRADDLSVNALGEDHINTLHGKNLLAVIYHRQGKTQKAEVIMASVVATLSRVLGANHSLTLGAERSLAIMYKSLGRLEEAERLIFRAAKTFERILGEEHHKTINSLLSLALVYDEMERLREAEEILQRILPVSRRVLPRNHPLTLDILGSLASTYRKQGRFEDGEELQVQVWKSNLQLHGENYSGTLIAMAHLAATYRDQGRYEDCEELETQVWHTCSRILGEKHPDTLYSMSNLVVTYSKQGRIDEATELGLKAWTMSLKVLGKEHPRTLVAMSNVAWYYHKQGRTDKAIDLGLQAWTMISKVQGESHPSTLLSMRSLAVVYWEQGRLEDGLGLLRRQLVLARKALGQDHEQTLDSERTIVKWEEFMKSQPE